MHMKALRITLIIFILVDNEYMALRMMVTWIIMIVIILIMN